MWAPLFAVHAQLSNLLYSHLQEQNFYLGYTIFTLALFSVVVCVPTFMLVYFMSNLNDSWYVSGRVHSRCVSSLSLWLLLLPVWVHHLKCSLLPDQHLHQLSKTDGRCIAMWRHMPWIDTHHSVLHTALLVVLVRIYRTCLNLWRLFLWSTPV